MTPKEALQSLSGKGYSITELAAIIRDKNGFTPAISSLTRVLHGETEDPRWSLGAAVIALDKRLKKKRARRLK